MERITRVHEILEEHNLDAVYLTKESNVNYISGFTDETGMAIISKTGKILFLSKKAAVKNLLTSQKI